MSKTPKASRAACTPAPACSTPRHLYDRQHSRRDVFTLQINAGGELGIKERGEITIEFMDGKFSTAHYPFSGQYTRNGWRILASIEAEISRIESELSNTTTQRMARPAAGAPYAGGDGSGILGSKGKEHGT